MCVCFVITLLLRTIIVLFQLPPHPVCCNPTHLPHYPFFLLLPPAIHTQRPVAKTSIVCSLLYIECHPHSFPLLPPPTPTYMVAKTVRPKSQLKQGSRLRMVVCITGTMHTHTFSL